MILGRLPGFTMDMAIRLWRGDALAPRILLEYCACRGLGWRCVSEVRVSEGVCESGVVMAAKLVKTETRGIYRRHGKDCDRAGRCKCPYVVVYSGKTRTFIRLVEAREGKAAMEREAKLTRGHALGLHRDEPREGCPDCERELAAHGQVAPFFHAYALEWVERYQGTGRRGYREKRAMKIAAC